MNHAKFIISEFKNPSGQIAFRVSGWLEGKRVRKNFATRAEAKAEADVLEIRCLQGETGVRPTVTRLSEDQLKEAEAMAGLLASKPRSLAFYVQFALANYREPVCTKPFPEAMAEYIASKKHEVTQDLIAEAYVSRLECEMNCALKRLPVLTVGEITSTKLLAYFEHGNASRKTYNNRRGAMSGFLKYAFRREWIAENRSASKPPVSRCPRSGKTIN